MEEVAWLLLTCPTCDFRWLDTDPNADCLRCWLFLTQEEADAGQYNLGESS